MKTTTILAAALLAASGTAFAQQTTTTAAPVTLVEIPDATTLAPWNMTVDQVDDMDLFANGVKVGELNEVYGPTAEQPTHVSVEFDDDNGSPFADRDDVLVPLEAISVANNQLTTTLTPEQAAALPTHDN